MLRMLLPGNRAEVPDILQAFFDIITLQDYNTRIVIFGTMLFGIAAGIMGSFLVLRKRALLTDAISHATLPGIGVAFMILAYLGTESKSLFLLLIGAAVSGSISILFIRAIKATTRLKEDAALGIALSFFFGLGMALISLISRSGGDSAGLSSFIYGKTASMVASDAKLMAWGAAAAIVIALVFLKEIRILCFDPGFASSQGYPVGWLDLVLLILVVLVTVVGLQAVGAILVVAMLIIPAAAARFWTHGFGSMVTISAVIGGLSSAAGAIVSGVYSNLPAGALIVLVATGFFCFSLVFGSARGVFHAILRSYRLRVRMENQHLLRAVYEVLERQSQVDHYATSAVDPANLQGMRAWTVSQLKGIVSRLVRDGSLVKGDGVISLTEKGFQSAARIVRNHRLWEVYLITYADIAPSHVDRDADMIEHVLNPELIEKLEARLADPESEMSMPESPHLIGGNV